MRLSKWWGFKRSPEKDNSTYTANFPSPTYLAVSNYTSNYKLLKGRVYNSYILCIVHCSYTLLSMLDACLLVIKSGGGGKSGKQTSKKKCRCQRTWQTHKPQEKIRFGLPLGPWEPADFVLCPASPYWFTTRLCHCWGTSTVPDGKQTLHTLVSFPCLLTVSWSFLPPVGSSSRLMSHLFGWIHGSSLTA